MFRHLIRALGIVWSVSPVYMILISLVSVIQGLAPIALLYVGKILLDLVAKVIQGEGGTNTLPTLLLIVALESVISLVSVGLNVYQNFLDALFSERLSHDIQHKILFKISEMSLASFEDSTFYDRMQNAYQEAGTRPIEIVSQVQGIIRSTISIISFVTVLFVFEPWILLILLATAIPSFLIQVKYGSLNYWMLRFRMPDLRKQEYFSYVLQTDWLIKELKLFNLEGHFLERFNTFFHRFISETTRLQKRQLFVELGGSLITALGILAARVFVILEVIARHITVGDFVLYSGAIVQFQSRLGSVLGGVSNLYSHSLFISNLFEFLDLPTSDLDKGEIWTDPIVTIEFRDVSFCYPGTDRLVLHDINFIARRGQTLSVVGPNGAGKTTFIKLLCNLYQPVRGQILLNGKDAKHYSQRSIQHQVSATFQDFGRYELTAQENIEVGRIDASNDKQRLHKATLMAGIKDDIENLQNGYVTQLGRWFDEGQQLSGGQWQKLALARAYFRDASVVILDEPTSALDAKSEFEMYQSVKQQQQQKITILISHRLSTARLADQIIVFENGCIIERGSHEQLLSVEGYYKTHFELQAGGYR